MPKTPSEVKCQRVVCFPRRNGDIYNSFSIDAIARYGGLEQVALPASLTFVDPNPKLQDGRGSFYHQIGGIRISQQHDVATSYDAIEMAPPIVQSRSWVFPHQEPD